jgi:hypothetical protein
MLETEKTTTYQAFGLTISSDLEFPELIRTSEQIVNSDIEIKLEEISSLYSDLYNKPNTYRKWLCSRFREEKL